jgi:hypothetical protein
VVSLTRSWLTISVFVQLPHRKELIKDFYDVNGTRKIRPDILQRVVNHYHIVFEELQMENAENADDNVELRKMILFMLSIAAVEAVKPKKAAAAAQEIGLSEDKRRILYMLSIAASEAVKAKIMLRNMDAQTQIIQSQAIRTEPHAELRELQVAYEKLERLNAELQEDCQYHEKSYETLELREMKVRDDLKVVNQENVFLTYQNASLNLDLEVVNEKVSRLIDDNDDLALEVKDAEQHENEHRAVLIESHKNERTYIWDKVEKTQEKITVLQARLEEASVLNVRMVRRTSKLILLRRVVFQNSKSARMDPWQLK